MCRLCPLGAELPGWIGGKGGEPSRSENVQLFDLLLVRLCQYGLLLYLYCDKRKDI